MKTIKFFTYLLATFIIFTSGSVNVSAANSETPADIVARLTGKSAADIAQEKHMVQSPKNMAN